MAFPPFPADLLAAGIDLFRITRARQRGHSRLRLQTA
jgi:hypothetical protein